MIFFLTVQISYPLELHFRSMAMLKFFKKLIAPFSRMKSALGQKIRALFSRASDASSFEELEQLFYEADLGPTMAAELVEKLRVHARKNPNPDSFLSVVKEELTKVFTEHPR